MNANSGLASGCKGIVLVWFGDFWEGGGFLLLLLIKIFSLFN